MLFTNGACEIGQFAPYNFRSAERILGFAATLVHKYW